MQKNNQRNSSIDDFNKYIQLQHQGRSTVQVYIEAEIDKLDFSACIRMLRQVFGISLIEAKEVSVIGKNLAQSLQEHQAKFKSSLEIALKEIDKK